MLRPVLETGLQDTGHGVCANRFIDRSEKENYFNKVFKSAAHKVGDAAGDIKRMFTGKTPDPVADKGEVDTKPLAPMTAPDVEIG